MKGVTKLIADAPGIADGFVYISMRMAVYPVIIRKMKRATLSERIVPKIKRNDSPFQNEAYL